MKPQFDPKEAIEHYEELPKYADTRTKEISEMTKPFIEITDKYGRLICRIVHVLGSVKPKDTQDIVIRDLMSDVFDALYESRPLILAGKVHVSFPVARRAYESLSLLHCCVLDKTFANKWHKGKKIENAEVRKKLGSHPEGESEMGLRELYSFFCKATHPNRALISRRLLGEGNKFVLGARGKPNLVLTIDYCIKILEMWFWLTATVSYFYIKEYVLKDKEYFTDYHQAAEEAAQVKQWLVENFGRLLKEEQCFWEQNPVGK
jgi:hypothetical protein